MTLDQRRFPKVVTVRVQQVEGDQHDFCRLALELVLEDREIGGAVGAFTPITAGFLR